MKIDENGNEVGHPKDITYGAARLCYGSASDGAGRGAGWVLPGGKRTENEIIARVAAINMDKIMAGVKL